MGLLDHYAAQGTEVHDPYGEISMIGMEMVDDVHAGVEVPVNQVLYKKIKATDPEAKFIIMELESGISGSNRNWRPEQLHKMARFVNAKNPVAYKGHIDPAQDHSAFPPMHALWLGARTVQSGDHCKLYLKGYLKTKEIRDEIDLGFVDAVSPRGDIRMRPGKGGVYDVVDFDCESIDFTRKGRNGLPSRIVRIGGEQITEGGKVEGKDIALISEQELRQYHPLLVKAIEDAATKPLSEKVGEMTTAAAVLDPKAAMYDKIAELFKDVEGANPLEKAAALIKMVEERFSGQMKQFIKDTVSKKLKGGLAQQLVERQVGEQIDLRGDFNDDWKKKATEAIEGIIEADEDLKAVVVKGGEQRTTNGNSGSGGGASFRESSKADEHHSGSLKVTKKKLTA